MSDDEDDKNRTIAKSSKSKGNKNNSNDDTVVAAAVAAAVAAVTGASISTSAAAASASASAVVQENDNDDNDDDDDDDDNNDDKQEETSKAAEDEEENDDDNDDDDDDDDDQEENDDVDDEEDASETKISSEPQVTTTTTKNANGSSTTSTTIMLKPQIQVIVKEEVVEEEPIPIWEPRDCDVLSGRGASVNAHGGNKKFRALCFARKPEFEAGNHAAKRRIATEIVTTIISNGNSSVSARFLKRKADKGPWYEMSTEQAILKACQVMRDYKRPDRLAIREMMTQNGNARKRNRHSESTPMIEVPLPTGPLEPIIENPFGVHDHDILSGRGAFVNGHVGNQRLRTLAMERKAQFDAGNYSEKRALATEIVQIIKSLDPPGRFLKRKATSKASEVTTGENQWNLPPRGLDGSWEELNDEKSIHKACQVMRDIDRPDRKDRELRRAKKKQKMIVTCTPAPMPPSPTSASQKHHQDDDDDDEEPGGASSSSNSSSAAASGDDEKQQERMNDNDDDGNDNNNDDDDDDGNGENKAVGLTAAEKTAVDEAVAATEEVLDKTLGAVPTDKVSKSISVTGEIATV